MKTVYLLGAGASAGSKFHLPTMKGFFQQDSLQEPTYWRLSNLIHEIFPGTDLSDVNLEVIVNHLEMSIDEASKRGAVQAELAEAQCQLMAYIVRRLNLGTRELVDPEHRELLNRLGSEDSILTLNYDEVMDHALNDLGPRNDLGRLDHKSMLDRSYFLLQDTRTCHEVLPTLHPEHKHRGFYIKLHGSVNWLYCPNPGCGYHQQIFPVRLDWQDAFQQGDPCSRCGSSLSRVIVPPSVSKTFLKFPKLGFLWRLAFDELVEAEHLVIIGMSLPESDFHFRWLLRESSRRRQSPASVDVVNPDVEVVRKVRDVIPRTQPLSHYRDLASYLAASL